jgi:hypothetical protein
LEFDVSRKWTGEIALPSDGYRHPQIIKRQLYYAGSALN